MQRQYTHAPIPGAAATHMLPLYDEGWAEGREAMALIERRVGEMGG